MLYTFNEEASVAFWMRVIVLWTLAWSVFMPSLHQTKWNKSKCNNMATVLCDQGLSAGSLLIRKTPWLIGAWRAGQAPWWIVQAMLPASAQIPTRFPGRTTATRSSLSPARTTLGSSLAILQTQPDHTAVFGRTWTRRTRIQLFGISPGLTGARTRRTMAWPKRRWS